MPPFLSAVSTLPHAEIQRAGDTPPLPARLGRLIADISRPEIDRTFDQAGVVTESLADPPANDGAPQRNIFAELRDELADNTDKASSNGGTLEVAPPAGDAAPLRDVFNEAPDVAPAHAPAVLSIPPELRRKLDMMEVSYDSQVRALNELEILLEGGLPLGDDMPFIPEGYRRAHLPVASFGMLAKMIQRDERRQRALDALTLDSTRSPIVMPDLCLGSLRRLVSIVRKKMPVYSLFRDGDYETSQPMPFDPDAIRSKKDGRSWAENERLAKEALIKASVSRADFLPIILMDSDPQVLPFTLNKNRREARAHCDELGLHLSSLVNYLVAQALLHEKDRLDGNGHWTWLNSWGTSAQANLCGRWAPEHRALLLSQPTNLERSPSIGIRQELRVIF